MFEYFKHRTLLGNITLIVTYAYIVMAVCNWYVYQDNINIIIGLLGLVAIHLRGSLFVMFYIIMAAFSLIFEIVSIPVYWKSRANAVYSFLWELFALILKVGSIALSVILILTSNLGDPANTLYTSQSQSYPQSEPQIVSNQV
ncbi:hypothetical protein BLNAU_15537 [Blattamonas nauphoetae]|uniref:Transmembrane protein n=1 Tax=Blattamonas nauphoetae TaxID=2049346 RepID=A0ABQ9XH89_9EUKA|nr:hypothetical protein BLNAU_15537 [Blattamonas nauphoetae]